MCMTANCGKGQIFKNSFQPKRSASNFPKPKATKSGPPRLNGGMGGFGAPRIGRVAFGGRKGY